MPKAILVHLPEQAPKAHFLCFFRVDFFVVFLAFAKLHLVSSLAMCIKLLWVMAHISLLSDGNDPSAKKIFLMCVLSIIKYILSYKSL